MKILTKFLMLQEFSYYVDEAPTKEREASHRSIRSICQIRYSDI